MHSSRNPIETDTLYDLIGIGIGPFNLSLACLSEPIEGFKTLFLDQSEQFEWHPGLMLSDAHLQTPFMSDLVTMADPTSHYSFLNYLKLNNRLYPFYIREDFFILRKEYNRYCQWASKQLSNLAFFMSVIQVEYNQEHQFYTLTCQNQQTNETTLLHSKHVVVGVGTQPYQPDFSKQDSLSSHVTHSSQYLEYQKVLTKRSSVAVIGSGQSAAEIFYDLLCNMDTNHQSLSWFTRSNRFFPLEYTKLTLEMTSPEYLKHFYSLPNQTKKALNQASNVLYKGINSSLINAIFDKLYEKSVENPQKVQLQSNVELQSLDLSSSQSGQVALGLYHHESQAAFNQQAEHVVLATGYSRSIPKCIDPIKSHLNFDEKGDYILNTDFSADQSGGHVFIQNAGFNSSGFITPDLGMVCYRNSIMLEAMLGYRPYPIEDSIAFQTFGLPK